MSTYMMCMVIVIGLVAFVLGIMFTIVWFAMQDVDVEPMPGPCPPCNGNCNQGRTCSANGGANEQR